MKKVILFYSLFFLACIIYVLYTLPSENQLADNEPLQSLFKKYTPHAKGHLIPEADRYEDIRCGFCLFNKKSNSSCEKTVSKAVAKILSSRSSERIGTSIVRFLISTLLPYKYSKNSLWRIYLSFSFIDLKICEKYFNKNCNALSAQEKAYISMFLYDEQFLPGRVEDNQTADLIVKTCKLTAEK